MVMTGAAGEAGGYRYHNVREMGKFISERKTKKWMTETKKRMALKLLR